MVPMRAWILIFWGLLLSSLAGAQTPPAAGNPAIVLPAASNASPAATSPADDPKPIDTFKKNVDLVPVIFTVTDKHGKFVKDLKQEEFKILDNNRPPKEIVNFESQTNLPLRVGL